MSVTNRDGSTYQSLIPDEVEVVPGPMADVLFTFTDNDGLGGHQVKAMMFYRDMESLRNGLTRAMAWHRLHRDEWGG